MAVFQSCARRLRRSRLHAGRRVGTERVAGVAAWKERAAGVLSRRQYARLNESAQSTAGQLGSTESEGRAGVRRQSSEFRQSLQLSPEEQVPVSAPGG